VTALALSHINFARMANDLRETKEWLQAIARHLNLSPSQLALNAGMAASTLTRFLNDRTNTIGITQGSLEKVARYSGFRPNQMPGLTRAGMAEPDTVPFAHDTTVWPKWVAAAVEAAKGGRNGVDAWVMKGAALDGVGILPGDILIIDQNLRAKTGDIVLAQIIDPVAGTADTVTRLYQAPFIMTHSMRLGPGRPEQVDDDRVSIAGVRIGQVRFEH
jgi:transcriptional regulator with XRE-family HTH domain